MKKLRLFSIFTLIVTLSLLLLVGCKKTDKISSVSLKDHDPSSVIEIPVGGFNYGAYTLAVSYESGKTEEIALTEEMIAEDDLFKFYQIGEHDITAVYENHKYVFKISVKRSTFGEITIPENNVFTYDGKYHTVEISGDLPANAVVTYPGGNSFVNAGTYDVNAIVSCEGYVTVRLSTTVKIERAVYDMSKVKFEPKEFVYDGQPHSVAISGTLPEGISKPTYVINEKMTSSAIDVGDYTVTATFSHKNPNYEPIPNMVTTLKITPANYTVRGVDIIFREANGKMIENNSKVYDGTVITFDINDYNKLSSKISVAFSVYDSEGKLLSSSNKNTKIKDAGTYKVMASFTLADGKNYKPIDPIVTEFEVLKAEYPLTGIEFDSERFVYDGKAHTIKIDGKLPTDVTVSYEYYLDDQLIKDGDGKPVQSMTTVGRYTVKAIFSHTDPNCNEIMPLSAVMQIAQANFDTSSLVAQVDGDLVYDGKGKSVKVTGTLPEGFSISFEYYAGGVLLKKTDGTPVTEVTEAGDYTVFIAFNVTNENYAPVNVMNYLFTIEKAEIDADGIEIVGEAKYDYDGNEHAPSVKSETVPESVEVTQTIYSVNIFGERTAVASAKDAGKYVTVFKIIPKDQTNYDVVNSNEIEWEFTIEQKAVDVSGVNISGDVFTYNGKQQLPTISIPAEIADLVVALATLYETDGMTQVDKAVDAGNYRYEVTLTAINSNYKLSSNEKLSFPFVILPQTIVIGGVSFESTEFTYNGTAQCPAVKGAPEGAAIDITVYSENGTDTLESAVNAGVYSCKVVIRSADGNYAYSGETELTTKFEIKKAVIKLDDIKFDQSEFKYSEDVDHATTILNYLNAEITKYVNVNVKAIYKKVEGGQGYLQSITLKEIGNYTVAFDVELKDNDNYVFDKNDESSVTRDFTVVE